MAKELEKNQFVLKCPACNEPHLLPMEASKNASFTCEKCDNKIYIKSDGTAVVFGVAKTHSETTGEKPAHDSSDKTGTSPVSDTVPEPTEKTEPTPETKTETESDYPLADW